MNIEVSVCNSRAFPVRFCRTPVFTRACSNNGLVSFFFSPLPFSLSLFPASVLVSGECTTLRPAVWTIGERAEVKGWRRREGERGRARHNKYNGWASSWRESPGDFAGFCNWNASRGGGKQGTRRINAIPLLYFATPSSQVEERQLNGMSKAILVPFLVPFVSSVSFLSFLSPSILFFFFLFYSFHLPFRYFLFRFILVRDDIFGETRVLLYSHIVRTRFLGKSLNVDVGSGFWLDQDRKRVNGSGVASLWIYI